MAARTDRLIAGALVAGQFSLLAFLGTRRRGRDWPTPVAVRRLAALTAVGALAAAAVSGRRLEGGLTASPLPNEHAILRTSGPYAVVRHPIYAGLLLASTARAVASGNRAVVAPTAGLWLLLSAKSRWEERRLGERFPAYASYAARTPRFVPRLRRT